MKQFATSKNGFNKEEVQKYIQELENKLEEKESNIIELKNKMQKYVDSESIMKEKEENISIALTAAVEKAKQIEKSSRNVYLLKIQELEILYKRWENVLNEMIVKYPNLDEVDNVKKLLNDFKSTLKTNLKEDFKFTSISNHIEKSQDPMKDLINKINSYLGKHIETKKEPKVKPKIRKQLSMDILNKQTELNKLEEKATVIKPIYNAKIEKGEKYENLLDKFLTQEAVPDSAYANIITAKTGVVPSDINDSGFDLKEAVNPKDSLETIMKSFDFFNN